MRTQLNHSLFLWVPQLIHIVERKNVLANFFDLPEIELNSNLWRFEDRFKLAASDILDKEKDCEKMQLACLWRNRRLWVRAGVWPATSEFRISLEGKEVARLYYSKNGGNRIFGAIHLTHSRSGFALDNAVLFTMGKKSCASDKTGTLREH